MSKPVRKLLFTPGPLNCPDPVREPTERAIRQWRWEPPPEGPAVVTVGTSFYSR